MIDFTPYHSSHLEALTSSQYWHHVCFAGGAPRIDRIADELRVDHDARPLESADREAYAAAFARGAFRVLCSDLARRWLGTGETSASDRRMRARCMQAVLVAQGQLTQAALGASSQRAVRLAAAPAPADTFAMELGIVGLARSGKTSLFNAVTRGQAQVGAYSSRTEPNVGVVHVPDERVDALAGVFKPKKITYAEIRWVDFPVAGFGPEGPGAAFIADLAQLDALVHVVRAFADESVPHDQVTIDPHRDLETLELELAFADLALIERRLTRIESEMRSVKTGERAALERQRALMQRLREHLESGRGLRSVSLDENDERELRNYLFVTRRPELIVVNIGEADLSRASEIEEEFRARYGSDSVAVTVLCAKLEAELAQMEPADAAEFRGDLGLPEESPLARAIVTAYELLGVHSFLTAGDDECRAWTVRRGAVAPEAAGKIHSDLERGFIRAEVARWQDMVGAGTMAELKRRGQLRTEGKSYIVQDGDVLNILFNV
ncbi:MAG: redox-regulated ATPase YchF [Chloroflexi bacterium]|nr:redox-regulated ATPase YchF [Chloroflexota bacterium]MDA1002822.1 redox-regulated ATPase YchF [Chloroflexota bacterium]